MIGSPPPPPEPKGPLTPGEKQAGWRALGTLLFVINLIGAALHMSIQAFIFGMTGIYEKDNTFLLLWETATGFAILAHSIAPAYLHAASPRVRWGGIALTGVALIVGEGPRMLAVSDLHAIWEQGRTLPTIGGFSLAYLALPFLVTLLWHLGRLNTTHRFHYWILVAAQALSVLAALGWAALTTLSMVT